MVTWEELKALAVVPKTHQRNEFLRKRWRASPKQCGAKAAFPSRRHATQAATSLANKNGDGRMAIYRCHICHHYHLTSKDRTT